MSVTDLICREEDRREKVRAADLYGIDYVEVGEDQRELELFFLGRAPGKLDKANVRISGGERITEIRVVDLTVYRQSDPTLDDRVEITLDRYGDFSTYTLRLVEADPDGYPSDVPLAGFDPRYAQVAFSFKASCPSELDCRSEHVCPPPRRDNPAINYLAKDYESFRRLILDRLALIMPDWRERHVPDIGIMLVELLAYVGDHLSYYQDAVATEAYLDTARQRISVRRHARLVDYAMHEGCNARAFVTIEAEMDTGAHPLDPAVLYFCTAFPGAPLTRTLRHEEVEKLPPGSVVAFSPLLPDPIHLYAAHNAIHFYTWGDCACCLPVGATRATLRDEPPEPKPQEPGKEQQQEPPKQAKSELGDARPLRLKVGDVLLFEEVIGPKTGVAADADPQHRQAVRLTKVTPAVDPLDGTRIVEIEWCAEDALTFPLCISARMPPPGCDCRDGISVARGNVILVENALARETAFGPVVGAPPVQLCPTDCAPGETVVTPEKFRPVLEDHPLTFAQPLPPCACAVDMIAQDPRRALPRVALSGALLPPAGAEPESAQSTEWAARRDLLASGPDDAHFVVEIDDAGGAHLRFGSGREGRLPEAGTRFTARYAIGNGPGGNVGAETINYIVLRETIDVGTLVPRNPLPASGGTAPEPVAEVKLFAPHAFRARLERAITAGDYATLAADNARRLAERADCEEMFHRLQAAKGRLRWTGSWYEAQVAVDPLGSESADMALLAAIDAYLERYRRVGHDLETRLARFAPIDLALTVCVQPHTSRAHVEAALREVFSNRVLPDGRLGFFHPDKLSFGDGIYLSRIVAAAQQVSGVMEVEVTRLARYQVGAAAPDGISKQAPASGVLRLAPFEVARLGADPNFPEHGRFTLHMRGGR